MAENQQVILCKTKEEIEATLKPLLADGWKMRKHPRTFKSLFVPSREDIADLTSITLERGSETILVKWDSPLATMGTGLTKMMAFENKLLLLGLFLATLVLILIHLFSSH